MWDLGYCILNEPDLSLGGLIPGTGPPFVIEDIGGEEMGQFTHGDVNDLLIGLGYQVDTPPPHHQEWAGGEGDLQNRIFGVLAFLAYDVYAGVYGQEGGKGEAHIVDGADLPIKINVQGNDGYTLQLIKLVEVWNVLPGLGGLSIGDANGHVKHVLIYQHLVTIPHVHILDSIFLVGNNIHDGTGHNDLPYYLLDMLGHGITQAIGVIPLFDST